MGRSHLGGAARMTSASTRTAPEGRKRSSFVERLSNPAYIGRSFSGKNLAVVSVLTNGRPGGCREGVQADRGDFRQIPDRGQLSRTGSPGQSASGGTGQGCTGHRFEDQKTRTMPQSLFAAPTR